MKSAFLAFCLALALPVAAAKLVDVGGVKSGTHIAERATLFDNYSLSAPETVNVRGQNNVQEAWCEQRDAAKRKA